MPLRNSFLMSASLHAPMPVSLSGVMFGAVTSNGGTLKRRPPEKSLPATTSGGPLGEWQLPQVMMVLTRYAPRSTGVSAQAPPTSASVAMENVASRIMIPSPIPARTLLQRAPAANQTCVVRANVSSCGYGTQQKGQPRCPQCRPYRGNLRRSGSGLFGPRQNGPGILALGFDVAIDELDHRNRRGIAVAEAGLHDAGIAAIAVLVARADHLEQFLDHGEVAHLRDRLAARMQVAALAERDQLLDDRTQILRLGQRRGDLLVLDQRRAQVRQHRFAMIRAAAELAVGLGVTHGRLLRRQGSGIRYQGSRRSLIPDC